MAEVRPLQALHYNLSAVPSLADVTAPPYDVIDADAASRAARPLAVERGRDRPARRRPAGGDPYEHADETLEAWTLQGVLDGRPRAGDLGADPGLPGTRRRAARTRHGFLARVRVTEYGPGLVRPHERTQPGPKEDRLRLTQATRHNLSPIFALHPGTPGATSSPSWPPIPGARSPTPTARCIASGGSPTPPCTRRSPQSSPTPSS